ncbi:MAG: hypothetical protein HWN81_15590 [Candidatus Lokiarchaeota archaeon]|nr:hypothetical protein [Candidatus Lokiarchaeota archaeon]
MEEKSAYPYITKFKKEPFTSFINIKRRDICNFYYTEYNKLVEFYQHFNQILINDPQLKIDNVFWLLLLRKYLKEEKRKNREEIFTFIKNCEVQGNEQIGFKHSPHSEKNPDICSTFFALSSLKNLGLLNEYLISEGRTHAKEQIKNFVLSLKRGNRFLHCQDKECEICKNISSTRLLYFILEIFTILGVDVRVNRDQFRSYIDEKKKDSSLIFRLLCFKYLDLDLEVKDKEIQLLQQLQKENGGFNFNENDNIDITFWVVYDLELYSWLLDYNPAGIYSFITQKLKKILETRNNWDSAKLNKISKLIILLSIIWKKFIDEIERMLFKQLEREKYVDMNQLKSTFGLAEYIEELVLYINLNYNFKLQILDNESEYKNYISSFSYGKKEFLQNFYDKLKNNSIISLSELFKIYKTHHLEPLKLKEEIFPIIRNMVEKKFFIGKIRTKKIFLGFKTRYLFYLKYLLKKIIVCNVDLNTESLYEEKEKLDDIKNDIYNMTLKLKNVSSQIREEIESYLLINEIEYAKERLKFILRDALMEADFLNENIEGSFNEVLRYINIQASLGSEISQWKKAYSVLQKRLAEVDSYLKGKIQEKEELRNLTSLLENLKERIVIIEEDLIKKLDSFRKDFTETLEKGYNKEILNIIIQSLDKLSQNIRKYDQIIYSVSQQVTIKERKIVKKHKKIIDNWIRVKEHFSTEFNYYIDGFQFFNINLQKIEEINEGIKADIIEIGEKAKSKTKLNEFQDAFNFTKREYDVLMKDKLTEIKDLQSMIKREVRKKQKLYLLYRYLQEKLENLETEVIELIANQVKTLKNYIIEERNKSKIEDFDNFISQESVKLKSQLNVIKTNFYQSDNLKIDYVIKEFENIQDHFNKANKLYLKKLNECTKNIENFKEQSELRIIQWEKFNDSFNNEISVLKDENINKIISNKVNTIAIEKKTNYIKLEDLKKEVKLSCKVLINRLKDMIDISKINAQLNEEEKSILVYTEYYYLNKELKNNIDNHILKLNRERIGKILALYDSSIRNRTLNVNMLELQNRINELRIFDDFLLTQFYEKVKELKINQERKEFLETKKYFESILENEKTAINNIKNSLELFNQIANFIEKQFNTINTELREYSNKVFKRVEGYDNYIKIQETFGNKKILFNENFKKVQDKIEKQINLVLNATDDSNKLIPEIRESYVIVKNSYTNEYEHKLQKIKDQIIALKNESFREQLLTLINDKKIFLSQLLGNLERKVEDNIEIKEFKKSNFLIQKRAKSIELEIKEVKRHVDTIFKDFSKMSKNFKQISKFILDDFDKFIDEYTEILSEKVKALERLILKSYIDMTIKAVANEYLTIGFLNNELKIKKQNIQDHLIFLISSGQLPGKFDHRISIYFENPEVLDELDETELEVIKSTNYKINMMLRHLKNLASQYGSVIAFFASIITISYYLFLFSGNNPTVIAFPIVITVLILVFYILRKGKEQEIK